MRQIVGRGPYSSEEDSPILQQATGKVCEHHTPLLLLSLQTHFPRREGWASASLLALKMVPCQCLRSWGESSSLAWAPEVPWVRFQFKKARVTQGVGTHSQLIRNRVSMQTVGV